MKPIIRICLLTAMIFVSVVGSAQNSPNPVKWDFSYEAINESEGYVILKASIEEHWHIYSQLQSADGPIATSFVFQAGADYSLVGKTEEPPAEKTHSEVFGADVIRFSKQVVFKQKIKRFNLNTFILLGELEYMACNDSVCQPPKTIKFTVNIPGK